MDYDEALRLLRGGVMGTISEWNQRRSAGEAIPDLRNADLSGAVLGYVHLDGVNLHGVQLAGAKFIGANLSGCSLRGANLLKADFSGALLSDVTLMDADLRGAILRDAHLLRALLDKVKFTGADLRGADLERSSLGGADFSGALLSGAKFNGSGFSRVTLVNTDLSEVSGLDSVFHGGPSSVGTDTLTLSRGRIPEAFLRGCGLTPWEVLSAGLYDPSLTPPQVAELQYRIFDAWTKGRSMINGCFISYSWEDARFVDKLRDRLVEEGVNVWLDKHDMVAGPLQDQVWRAIQIQHVVLLVLSKDSIQSDWVENELDMARSKEKAEGRAVLCPIALDDAWKLKVEAKGGPGDASRALWRMLTQKLVVDFSRWKTKAFEEAFSKLLRGLKVNYGP